MGTGVAMNLINLGYSCGYEHEADKLALRYVGNAGYRPEAMLDVFAKLKAQQTFETPQWRYFLRSPPYIEEGASLIKKEMSSGNELSMKKVPELV